MSNLDQAVRLHIYRKFVMTGRALTMRETAEALFSSSHDVEAAHHRLAEAHILLLAPEGCEVWMGDAILRRTDSLPRRRRQTRMVGVLRVGCFRHSCDAEG